MKILVTGCAGFIGYHVCGNLLETGAEVVGIDNLNPYYSLKLKAMRIKILQGMKKFLFLPKDLSFPSSMDVFVKFRPHTVVHLAAQPGVRYSLEHPEEYINSNILGTFHVFEACRLYGIRKVLYASSSSVYGGRRGSHEEVRLRPESIYAATKISCEALAEAYYKNHGISSVGMRYFTVYGPWGRPDMAMIKFADRIMAGEPIEIYNHGDMSRSFTYIDDVVNATVRLAGFLQSDKGCQKVNVGTPFAEPLYKVLGLLERELGRKAKVIERPMHNGDVKETCAHTGKLKKMIGFEPSIRVERGISEFVKWYRRERANW